MKTLKVTLKQHTPLIHFQHDQYGATLRASEVKPKLDKFLLFYDFDNSFINCAPYLVGYNPNATPDELRRQREKFENGIRALDYSLKIESSEQICKPIPIHRNDKGKYETKMHINTGNRVLLEDFPFLLANMGGKEQEDELINLVMYSTVNLIIHTRSEELYRKLKEDVVVFFGRNNFGQRATKGFGSFTVSSIDGKKVSFNQKNIYLKNTHYFSVSFFRRMDGELEKQYNLFKSLDFYWKCLKSGVNYTQNQYQDRYIKSYLWKYLRKKAIYTWEKKQIKTSFNLLTGYPCENPSVSGEPVFARALLGCPDKFEYRYKDIRRISHNECVKIKFQDSDNLERIPTPIIFKPVWNDDNKCFYVYILIDNKIKKALNNVANTSVDFSCGNQIISLDINTDCINNYSDFISDYHDYLREDEELYNLRVSQVNNPDDIDFVPLNFAWKKLSKIIFYQI